MKRILFFSSMLVVLTLFSCKKDKSVIMGQVQVDTPLGTIEAQGADVYLYTNTAAGAPAAPYAMKKVADASGNFSFENVEDGSYVVYAETTIAGIDFDGSSAVVKVKGDDSKTVNLVIN